MLLPSFLLLIARAAEALVLSSSVAVLPNIVQSSWGDHPLDDTSLNTIASSAWLDNASSQVKASSVSLSNSSLALNNVSAEIKFLCQERFGSNLNLQSCQSAALSIEYQLTTPYTWGPRDTAITYDFPMPQRWVSSDGTCIIEALLGPGSTFARASLQDLAMGAYTVVQKCVEQKSPGEGGIAKDLGECAAFIFSVKD
ncbi:MAG: hypothetical protein ALECFALPRED_000407 [Alectoria fallacina]|uniref:Uncharacterized protein n=1 Tax=Alectoria fallacina TaxID=1903189 RepID=A0A8H3JAK9_9LECA|nr:MAG: hypothetical protein ALECFALPRED_000407 [Alectoria fallacina]